MIKLTSVEIEIIMQYRELDHGEIRITKRNGDFAKAQTIKEWVKAEVTRARPARPSRNSRENP